MKRYLFFLMLALITAYRSDAQVKYLWANAAYGGDSHFGTILQGDSDGAHFHRVYSFDSTNGSLPIGKMAMTGGKLYVATQMGGTDDSCCIGEYDPILQTYRKLYDFADDRVHGYEPMTGLIKATDGKLYGTTFSGGAYEHGVIYSLDPVTSIYADVHDFDSTGFAPSSELLQASDGKLYGVTEPNNLNLHGKIFSFDPLTHSYIECADLPGGMGAAYSRMPLQAYDGNIYGIVQSLLNDTTVMYRYDVSTRMLSLVRFMTPNDGQLVGGLTDAKAGKLYGLLFDNLAATYEIYSYDIATGAFNSVAALLNGEQPKNHTLTYAGGSKLYFSARTVGGSDIIESYDLITNAFTILFTCNNVSGYEINGELVEGMITEQATDVPNIRPNQIELYPNPVGDALYLRNAAGGSFIIMNILGEEVMTGSVISADNRIDVSVLPSGIYLINQTRFVKY